MLSKIINFQFAGFRTLSMLIGGNFSDFIVTPPPFLRLMFGVSTTHP